MTSTVKVNNVQASDGGNIINQCGTNITIGASGDTIALASGASQTGFGRTGTVDWQTSSIKTATFTAANGEGYFCNTAGGTFEVDLPAGSAGAIVSIQDYNNTFDTNALTVDPNGSEKINGGVAGETVTLNTEGQGVTFVYIDSTVGWRSVQDNTYAEKGQSFVTATGGTITTVNCGSCKVHTFTGPGTFCVSAIATTPANNQVSYMVVGGGGAGRQGIDGSGGGGAGGFREDKSPVTPYTASPLEGAGAITVTAAGFPITVGGGGPGGQSPGSAGVASSFSTITSAGGGGGGAFQSAGIAGASGGGGGGRCGYAGGAGNTPPVSPAQGFAGGTSKPQSSPSYDSGGGGGGATTVGANGGNDPNPAGAGGTGATTSISGSPTVYSGGGGGARETGGGGTGGAAGSGGGGAGGTQGATESGAAGTANTGGGGGAGVSSGAGGSGIVIIRYKIS